MCVSNDKQDDVPAQNGIPQLTYKLVNTYPHDTSAFTEGLCWYKGKLYESTGPPDNLPHTKSYFGVVDTQNGIVKNKVELDRKKFSAKGLLLSTILFSRLPIKAEKDFYIMRELNRR